MNPEICEASIEALLVEVTASAQSVLLLDFDGTLAPFRIDPARVRPWAGVTELLNDIQATNRTHIAIISGREARQVAAQLGMQHSPEIWGLHGAERLWPDGTLDVERIPLVQQSALDDARATLKSNAAVGALDLRFEEKRNAVVVHWRGKTVQSAQAAKELLAELLTPYGEVPGLELLHFDGGIELRYGPDKGDAVRTILNKIDHAAPVAYLGDDTTDEFAFRALEGRGVGILVRRTWRPTAAQIWLQPPAQLKSFLSQWLSATTG